jgi:arylsulfatase A-like enzyme
MYRDADIDLPAQGSWSTRTDDLPAALRVVRHYWPAEHGALQHAQLRRAYYALCTHIDHQIRILIGTLREENLLDNTVVLLTADHGDMLGQHGLWAKSLFYEAAANVPMILVGTAACSRVKTGAVDDRLVGLQDVMPTLLDLAGLPVPATVEGLSLLGIRHRDSLYGECGEGRNATRMLHDGRHKLIWYPANHCVQLFDLEADPLEMTNLAEADAYRPIRERLEAALVAQLYGSDLDWVRGGRLAGYDPGPFQAKPNRALAGQRGLHYPPPPVDDPNRSANRPP